MALMTAYITDDDVERYTNLLREMKVRLDQARQVLLGAIPQSRFSADLAAAELRIVLELLLLGGLITNRIEVAQASSAFHKRDHSGAKKIVERVNAGYWPKPTIQVNDGPGRFKLEDVTHGFLTPSEWGPAYGFLSDQLHATNPYAAMPFSSESLAPVFAGMAGIHERLVALLNHHWIQPSNRDYALIGQMETKETGDVQVALFQRQGDATGTA
jgi:hypothetical protein